MPQSTQYITKDLIAVLKNSKNKQYLKWGEALEKDLGTADTLDISNTNSFNAITNALNYEKNAQVLDSTSTANKLSSTSQETQELKAYLNFLNLIRSQSLAEDPLKPSEDLNWRDYQKEFNFKIPEAQDALNNKDNYGYYLESQRKKGIRYYPASNAFSRYSSGNVTPVESRDPFFKSLFGGAPVIGKKYLDKDDEPIDDLSPTTPTSTGAKLGFGAAGFGLGAITGVGTAYGTSAVWNKLLKPTGKYISQNWHEVPNVSFRGLMTPINTGKTKAAALIGGLLGASAGGIGGAFAASPAGLVTEGLIHSEDAGKGSSFTERPGYMAGKRNEYLEDLWQNSDKINWGDYELNDKGTVATYENDGKTYLKKKNSGELVEITPTGESLKGLTLDENWLPTKYYQLGNLNIYFKVKPGTTSYIANTPFSASSKKHGGNLNKMRKNYFKEGGRFIPKHLNAGNINYNGNLQAVAQKYSGFFNTPGATTTPTTGRSYGFKYENTGDVMNDLLANGKYDLTAHSGRDAFEQAYYNRTGKKLDNSIRRGLKYMAENPNGTDNGASMHEISRNLKFRNRMTKFFNGLKYTNTDPAAQAGTQTGGQSGGAGTAPVNLAAALAWAGQNYMDHIDTNAKGFDFTLDDTHNLDALLKQIADFGEIADETLLSAALAKANGKNAWGDKSNELYTQAIDNLLQSGNYEKARSLMNWMTTNKDQIGYNGKPTLADVSNKFDNTAKKAYLMSDAGNAAMNNYYNSMGIAGYVDDYNNYLARQGFTANYNKKGGKMNKYQQGGAAPQQDMQAQVAQLVQAAMSGDEKATQTINKIMEAAKAGDQQALQIAQMIQAVAQQMQGQQAQAAKRGAKLSYIHQLASGCPDGTEAKYYKKGGHICKACVEKAKKAACGTKAQDGAELEKCGGKAKKKYFGGNVDPNKARKACSGAKTPKAENGVKTKKCANGGTLDRLKALFAARG